MLPGYSKAVAAPSPSDTVPLDPGFTLKAIYVGSAGGHVDVAFGHGPSATVTFSAVPAGTILPIAPRLLKAATTSTGLVLLGD